MYPETPLIFAKTRAISVLNPSKPAPGGLYTTPIMSFLLPLPLIISTKTHSKTPSVKVPRSGLSLTFYIESEHGASKLGKGGNKTPSIVTPIFTFYTRFSNVQYQNKKNRLAKSRFYLYL